jgi:hypothetical protein
MDTIMAKGATKNEEEPIDWTEPTNWYFVHCWTLYDLLCRDVARAAMVAHDWVLTAEPLPDYPVHLPTLCRQSSGHRRHCGKAVAGKALADSIRKALGVNKRGAPVNVPLEHLRPVVEADAGKGIEIVDALLTVMNDIRDKEIFPPIYLV